MKSKTHLDSVVFQLTPTRTRCDLVITANGKTEKIASGLLNPFLAHLKAAQEQIGKGGYSIVLEPHQGVDAPWFTKGTVERFVRFVSSPDILERVYTIESEILQIEKAIAVHVNTEAPVRKVEDLPAKAEESIEGRKSAVGGGEEKAIVLYEPVNHQKEEDGSTMQKNSKVQLLQVLQTRKTALQKEQDMAFARAVAASFDINNITALLSFAECFGASRMMDACKRFLELWKAKHEIGQWDEIEMTNAAMSCRSDLPSMNPSGITFVNSNEQVDVASENNGVSSTTGGDVKLQEDRQGKPKVPGYIPGQFAHPMFPPWQMHPQANGVPIFQAYSPQGQAYYQNYPGNSPYFQPPYSPFDDSSKHVGQKTRERRHSMDGRDLSTDFDAQEDHVDVDDEDSAIRRSKKAGGKSSRKQSGVVVIRNINYIASADPGSSDGDLGSHSDPGTGNEEENVNVDDMRKLNKKGSFSKSKRKERSPSQVGDEGQWQAFQNFLLKDADESSSSARSNMFEMEGKVQGNKRQTAKGDAASILRGHNLGENSRVGCGEHHEIAGDMTRLRKQTDDQMLNSGRREGKLSDVWDASLDPIIANGVSGALKNNNRGSLHGISDESSMIMPRSGSVDGRTAMDMNYEVPSVLEKAEDRDVRTTSQSNYEPNDLNLMPNRVMGGESGGYDPALDYELQAQVKKVKPRGKEENASDAKERPRKGVKDQKLKAEKRITASTRREKLIKLSPSEDARARAEKLRAFKADLQKQKKEKEEEQKKRIEALKLERQKRIAARSGANAAQSSLPSPQARKQLPKLSPVSQKGSKFSDTEPGSSSPLQRSTLKIISKLNSDPNKASKSRRLTYGSSASENRLTRSASSLRVRKEENNDTTPEFKTSTARIRRLSEPKGTFHQSSSEKMKSAEAVSRRRVSEGSEIKKMRSLANLQKNKSTASPEPKSRVSKRPTFSAQKKTTTEMLQKPSSKMISRAPVGANLRRDNAKNSPNMSQDNAKISSPSEANEDTLVEKTVVMLERGTPSNESQHASVKKLMVKDTPSAAYNPGSKPEEDVSVPPPASPITVKEVDQEPSDGQVIVQSETHLNERVAPSTQKELSNISSSSIGKTPYQPPYARVSSLEDPCMTKSDYEKALPAGLDMATPSVGTSAVYVSDNQWQDPVKVSDISGKHQGKESSRGFRQLFKFGKKTSAGNESNIESGRMSVSGSVVGGHASNAISNEVFTLRNLLIQEENSNAATTPKKSSRSFSLLSPFRSKNREKLSA